MSQPTLPPYLGSLEELIQALLHNPYLGSGRGGRPHLHQAQVELNPQPLPPSPSPGTALFVSAIAMRDIASRMSDGANNPIANAVGQAVADWEDWYCGTPPQPHPHVLGTVVELLGFAASLAPGSLRNGLAQEAGTLLQKSFGTAAAKPVAVTSIAS